MHMDITKKEIDKKKLKKTNERGGNLECKFEQIQQFHFQPENSNFLNK